MNIPGENLIIKMWDSLVDKGIGSILQPWQERRVGESRLDLKRQEILKIAEAERLAEDIRNGNIQFESPQLENFLENRQGRIEPTLGVEYAVRNSFGKSVSENIRKEANVAKSILIAEDLLADDATPVNESKLEDDWLFNWQEYAGRVSSEDLQQLWGKILAGEIKSPGSYSYRTLDFLKTLSKADAEVIATAAQFVVGGVIFREHDEILEKAGVNFGILMYLQELGILSGVEAVGLQTKWKSSQQAHFIKALISYNHCLILKHENPQEVASKSVYLVTTIGKEVLSLAQFGANKEYLKAAGAQFAKQGFKVQVADWLQQTKDSGSFYNAEEIVA
ncbi:TPA: DUF2806 domain-containing protein [Vibrio cholerae]|uniref:DUF2806 domain-containing protein n=1 Tax=Vibrio cholerae TaxID=666 RepID=UPI001182551D|nr:DUF2806 domain-containing protein [Vibrio cholerae]TVN42897.1 DUF2806 domain-containing protein [Vibrio cholerae]GHW72741.1 membrane-fusion protein [Vibrio cholerae]HDV5391062.1 DUF2806 domain-containing protein [Vibrio cholerae]HDV5398203.1 DUF2806 domain-containing protein [Vibrio cholerae]HDV5412705.1 DUF2806 domain-containing protein [Vibrio cholerae]